MDDRRFSLIFEGRVIPGFARRDVIERVAGRLERSPETIQRLFREKPVTVKKGLDARSAARQLRVFENLGVACRIEPQESESVPQPGAGQTTGAGYCPKCRADLRTTAGREDECPFCGIIVSKYLKARQQAAEQARQEPGAGSGAGRRQKGAAFFRSLAKDRARRYTSLALAVLAVAAACYMILGNWSGSADPRIGSPPPAAPSAEAPAIDAAGAPGLNGAGQAAAGAGREMAPDRGVPCARHEYVLDHGGTYELLFHARLDLSRKPPEPYPDIRLLQFSNANGTLMDNSGSYIRVRPAWIDIASYPLPVWAMDRSAHVSGDARLSIEDGISTPGGSIFKVYWMNAESGLITLGGPFQRIEAVGRLPESTIRSRLSEAPEIQVINSSYSLKDLPIYQMTYPRYVAAVKFKVEVPAHGSSRTHFAHMRYAIGDSGGISLRYKSWGDKILFMGPDERIECYQGE